MNYPTPAIVTQRAARPIPRWALLLLCVAYVVPGFIGRDPWRYADVAALGYMQALAQGHSPWLAPQMLGLQPEGSGLLPFWLGAWALQALQGPLAMLGWGAELVVRLPFIGLLCLSLWATWYSAYYLARNPGAQPVAFAFGGEADPRDYAHSIADAALLALLACLGLAQMAHETTAALVQLACTSLVLLAAALWPYHRWRAAALMPLGLLGLTLAGAPALATLLGLGGTLLGWTRQRTATTDSAPPAQATGRRTSGAWLAVTLVSAALGWVLHLWAWRVEMPPASWVWVQAQIKLLVWFGWPAWPLALWTLWRWRHQLTQCQQHLWLPLGFVGISLGATLSTSPADRALLLGLPALSVLAAFALPTLQRSLAALIDWFTLLFFSLSAIAIWVVWLSLQTGWPAQPAANVARLAPGFTHSLAPLPLLVALGATLAWCALVRWRVVRHRTALWKSLVLPAAGTTLAWLLLMTIWLPPLDYARSYAPQVRHLRTLVGPRPGCLLVYGMSDAQVAALQFHGNFTLRAWRSPGAQECQWLAVASERGNLPAQLRADPHSAEWSFYAAVGRPTNRSERMVLLHRNP